MTGVVKGILRVVGDERDKAVCGDCVWDCGGVLGDGTKVDACVDGGVIDRVAEADGDNGRSVGLCCSPSPLSPLSFFSFWASFFSSCFSIFRLLSDNFLLNSSIICSVESFIVRNISSVSLCFASISAAIAFIFLFFWMGDWFFRCDSLEEIVRESAGLPLGLCCCVE